MSNDNRISVQIKPADLKTVLDSIKLIQQTLKPYTVTLKDGEKSSMLGMKDKSSPFVIKALDYAQTNPEFAPSYMSIAELIKDVEAVTDFQKMERPLAQVMKALDDSTFLAGSEAYLAALSYYNSVKQAAKRGIPGAQTIYDDLSIKFTYTKAKSAKPASAAV